MTLAELNSIEAQLNAQYTHLLGSVPTGEKPVILLTNCIELKGALQLIAQLKTQEQISLSAPPGSTGPL